MPKKLKYRFKYLICVIKLNNQNNWIKSLARTEMGFSSFITNLPPDPQLTARFGIVADVTDPLSMGRVRLTFDNEANNFVTSEWVYTSHPGGNLSTEYIGQKCICVFESGDVNKAYVVGFIPSSETRAIGNPVKLPVIKASSNSEFGAMPECNEGNLGSVVLLEELSGTNQKICRRNDAGDYAWMGSNTPQVIRTNTVEARSPSEKIGDPISSYIPGSIFIRKTCDRDQFVPYISDYNLKGEPRYRPLVSATVYKRATIPDCNTENIGVMALIETSPEDTYPSICAKKAGKYRWVSISDRQPLKFNEPFSNQEDSVKYITDVTQNCKKPDNLFDSKKDAIAREPLQEISSVPEIKNKANLTSYINTPSFQDQLKRVADSRSADRGTKDRVNTLNTQMTVSAFEITDNNISQIEKIVDREIKNELKNLTELFEINSDLIKGLSRAIAQIAKVLPSGDEGTRGVGAMKARLTINNKVDIPISTKYSSTLDTYKNELKKIRDEELKETLEPGYPLKSFGQKEVAIPITTEQYGLDHALETEDPEGTQKGSKPYDSIVDAIETGGNKIGQLLTSLENFPVSFESIKKKAIAAIKSNISAANKELIESVTEFAHNTLEEYLLDILPADFKEKLAKMVEIKADGTLETVAPEILQTNFTDVLSNSLAGIEVIKPDNKFIFETIAIAGEQLGFSSTESKIAAKLIPFILSGEKLKITPQGIIGLAQDLGIKLPLGLDGLKIVSGDSGSYAEFAANFFFDPGKNKANNGELINLMLKSDVDAEGYLKNVISGVLNKKIPNEQLAEIVELFREKISKN